VHRRDATQGRHVATKRGWPQRRGVTQHRRRAPRSTPPPIHIELSHAVVGAAAGQLRRAARRPANARRHAGTHKCVPSSCSKNCECDVLTALESTTTSVRRPIIGVSASATDAAASATSATRHRAAMTKGSFYLTRRPTGGESNGVLPRRDARAAVCHALMVSLHILLWTVTGRACVMWRCRQQPGFVNMQQIAGFGATSARFCRARCVLCS
jgi:hypothetical protein